MTSEQFRTTPFVYGMKVLYKGEERYVLKVDFHNKWLTILMYDQSIVVDFSEVELISNSKE